MSNVRPWLRLRTGTALTRQAALLFLVSILPVLLGVGLLNYQYARTALEEQVHLRIRARTEHTQQVLANVLLRELERLRTLGAAPPLRALLMLHSDEPTRAAARAAYEQATPGDPQRQTYVNNAAGQVLKDFREQYPNRAVVLLVHNDGALEATTTGAWPAWDLTGQPWWPDPAPLRDGTPSLGRPVTVPGFAGPLLFLTAPVRDNAGQPVGVVAVGLNFLDLAKSLFNDDSSDASVPLLTTDDGTILYKGGTWPDAQLPGDWSGVVQYGPGAATLSGDVVGFDRLYQPEGYALDDPQNIRALNDLDWHVLRVITEDTAYAGLTGQLELLAAGTAITSVVVVVIALVVVRGLVTRPLRRLEAVVSDVREHGLAPAVTERAQDELPRGRNEIGLLARHFGQMLYELTHLTQERERTFAQQQLVVTSLRTAATRLSDAAYEQQAIIANTSTVLAQVLAAFQGLDQAAATIADYAQQVATQASQLKQQHQAGEMAVLTTQSAFSNLQETAAALETGAQTLAVNASAAETLVEEANEVAETTHILSLNAVIEAADAGEFGPRFGVIAMEVRQLAAAAAKAAESIEGTIARMAGETRSTAAATRQARQAIDSGAQQMLVLGGMMQALLQAADELEESAQRIRLSSADQRGHRDELHVSSGQLASAMQQVTAASRHVAGQAQELLRLASILDTGPELRAENVD